MLIVVAAMPSMKSLSLCFLIFCSLIVLPHTVRATLEDTSERQHLEGASGLASKAHVSRCISELRRLFEEEIEGLRAEIASLRSTVEEQSPFGLWLDGAVKKRGITAEDCILRLDLSREEIDNLLGRFRQRRQVELTTVSVAVRAAVLRFLTRYDEHVVFKTNLKAKMKGVTFDQLKAALALVRVKGTAFPEGEIDQLSKALDGADITYIPSEPFGNALQQALTILEFKTTP